MVITNCTKINNDKLWQRENINFFNCVIDYYSYPLYITIIDLVFTVKFTVCFIIYMYIQTYFEIKLPRIDH